MKALVTHRNRSVSNALVLVDGHHAFDPTKIIVKPKRAIRFIRRRTEMDPMKRIKRNGPPKNGEYVWMECGSQFCLGFFTLERDMAGCSKPGVDKG